VIKMAWNDDKTAVIMFVIAMIVLVYVVLDVLFTKF